MQHDGDLYTALLTTFLKKQIQIFGYTLVHLITQTLSELKINQDGSIKKIETDAKSILEKLIAQFLSLSPLTVGTSLESILQPQKISYENGKLIATATSQSPALEASQKEVKKDEIQENAKDMAEMNEDHATQSVQSVVSPTVSIDNPALQKQTASV